ncbi:hypothetical protein [Haloplanus sp.]|uniref:DUF5789 family protein n=1 Tax=Haloplanus sp. TaxID=1961696 RepID=UPI00260CE8A5|nr:hypothetical protein [Haloplanus sp.]
MSDDKSGRDKQAHDAEGRRQARALVEELERMDETKPPVETATLDEFEAELGALTFPVTGADVVASVGDYPIESADGSYTVADLISETADETFDAPTAVSVRVQRPTVAAAMKRVVEAAATLTNETLGRSQHTGYERTFRELRSIDAVDEDEGIEVIGDWIVGWIHEKETLPGSRDVRRQAAKFCRARGYEIRNDEWLGV